MVGSGTLGRRLVRVYIPLGLFLIFLLFPFYWMIIVSLKPTPEIFNRANNPFWINTLTLENYAYLFTSTGFVEWTKNTLIVATASTAIQRASRSRRRPITTGW